MPLGVVENENGSSSRTASRGMVKIEYKKVITGFTLVEEPLARHCENKIARCSITVFTQI